MNSKTNLSNKQLGQVAAGCFLGAVIGAASIALSPLIVLGMLCLIISIVAIYKYPEVGLLGILIATSSIVFEERLPIIPVGIGSLHVPDLLFLSLLGLIFYRRFTESDYKFVRTPIDRPLLVFFGITLISTAIAIARSSVDSVEARRMIHLLSYYLVFFVVTNLVKDRRQIKRLINGFLFLASIVAVAMIAQFLLGRSIRLLPGRVENLVTQGISYNETTRLLPPGLSILFVSFVTLVCIVVLEKSRSRSFKRITQGVLIGNALILTFLRSYWVAIIIAYLIMALVVRRKERRKLIQWSLAVLCLFIIILIPMLSTSNTNVKNIVSASFSRMATLWSSDTLTESSLTWRYIENRYAIRQILAHPIVGIGWGTQYRPFDSRIDRGSGEWDARNYIHNGHLWILLDTGLLGYLAFIVFSVGAIMRGFRYWRVIADSELRVIVLGFTLAYIGAMISAIVNPSFMQWRWTPVIGIIIGINEAIINMHRMANSKVNS